MVDLGGSRLFYNVNVLILHPIKAPERAIDAVQGITTGKGFFTVMGYRVVEKTRVRVV